MLKLAEETPISVKKQQCSKQTLKLSHYVYNINIKALMSFHSPRQVKRGVHIRTSDIRHPLSGCGFPYPLYAITADYAINFKSDTD